MHSELETERLRFRHWRESDVDPLYDFYRDPQSQAVYGSDFSRADVWRRVGLIIGHFHLRGFGLYALEDKESGKLAGYAGLWFPDGWDDVEVGYGITPQFRGRGFATEAARHARDENLRRVRRVGVKQWKEESHYHQRSLAETSVFRFKQIFGARLATRKIENQFQELFLKCATLNRMTHLGMPRSERCVG